MVDFSKATTNHNKDVVKTYALHKRVKVITETYDRGYASGNRRDPVANVTIKVKEPNHVWDITWDADPLFYSPDTIEQVLLEFRDFRDAIMKAYNVFENQVRRQSTEKGDK